MPIIPVLPTQLHPSVISAWKYIMLKAGAAAAAATVATTSSLEIEEERIGVMFIILFVSLFAVSFPSLSKQIRFLRIPGILFFIGKHFGTGVILATAFIHLLDDAFRSLADRRVEETYGLLGKWTGSIILASLLIIFLIEYISTSFVEHLNERPSAPSTPITSQPPSRLTSPAPQQTCTSRANETVSEITPLLSVGPPAQTVVPLREAAAPLYPAPGPLRSQTYHAPHPSAPHPHALNHTHQVQLPLLPGLSVEVLTNSPRICRMAMAHEHSPIQMLKGERRNGEPYGLEVPQYEIDQHHMEETEAHHRPRIGRRRQIVGLLVLQLGIMIHSFVIGLTLSVTSGSDFASLTTAIIFHQLFEGLSLGIRIASLPPKNERSLSGLTDAEELQERLEDEIDPPDPSPVVRASSGPTLVLSPHPNHEHHSANGIIKSPRRSSSKLRSTAFVSEGSSSKMSWKWRWERVNEIEWLKPTLTILFGVTTPLGMALGILLWSGKRSVSDASMLLTQGIMSAISAGLLIYAATVEMIAGDFVFGDVEGHHHHHHHAHDEGEEGRTNASTSRRARNDGSPTAGEAAAVEGAGAELGMEEEAAGEEPAEAQISLTQTGERGGGEEEGRKGTRLGKRALAVLSLFAGAGMMVLVGLGEGD